MEMTFHRVPLELAHQHELISMPGGGGWGEGDETFPAPESPVNLTSLQQLFHQGEASP